MARTLSLTEKASRKAARASANRKTLLQPGAEVEAPFFLDLGSGFTISRGTRGQVRQIVQKGGRVFVLWTNGAAGWFNEELFLP